MMKKHLTSIALLLIAALAQAQMVTDSVELGAQYANQVWYSLANDEQGTAPKNNWDIAFEINGISSSILLNSANGDELWVYPNSDITGWATLDTAGIAGWQKSYNSDTTWVVGAFNANYDPFDNFDLGWGVYNSSNHNVTGDSLFVIKLADGSYKKLWIIKLANSEYSFKYANLDNTGELTKTIAKVDYTGKNFGYFSLQTGTAANREPLAADWDITFTQYTGFVPIPYPVTGVLSNKNTGLVKVYPVNDPTMYDNYAAHLLSNRINTIGYNWKRYDNTLAKYVIEDSTVYFVKDGNDDVWKLVFTAFSSSTGKFVFGKEKLTSTNVGINNPVQKGLLTIYPNPAVTGTVSLVLDMDNTTEASVTITDITGKTVSTQTLQTGAGLVVHPVSVSGLATGLYTIQVVAGNKQLTQKLVINN